MLLRDHKLRKGGISGSQTGIALVRRQLTQLFQDLHFTGDFRLLRNFQKEKVFQT